jgi:hypothetical protein
LTPAANVGYATLAVGRLAAPAELERFMAKDSKTQDRPVKAALRKAFKAVEAQPVPAALAEHVDQLAAPKRRPDRRS